MKSVLKTSHLFRGSVSRKILILILCACLWLPISLKAQTVDFKETASVLQTKVHLKLGETTLTKVLRELSQQTGLQIQPADYLEERELLVELDNLSAQAALDTLAEANDWIWSEGKKGQIFVTRPKFMKTQQLLNVAPAFRAIVPKDLRRYIGLDLSDAEIRSAFRSSQINSDYVLKNPLIVDSLPTHSVLLPEMLGATMREQERKVMSWITDDVKTGKKIPYANMTLDQQHTLLNLFVFKAMYTVFQVGPMSADRIIMGLDPAGVDENQMRILYKEGTIYVGTLQGGKFTYGAGVSSEKELPDPLLLHTPF